MAINLASKFSKKVSERLVKETVIGGLTNRNFDWVGVDTVKVYSLDTFAMNDYSRNGDNRYGNPSELGDTLQTWTLAQDRSFTGTIDRLNHDQRNMVSTPGSVLARQVREEVVPEVDAYVLAAIGTAGAVANRDDIATDAATTASNAWTDFLLLTADIRDNEGADSGLVAVMTADYYNFLKQTGFVLASEKSQAARATGDLGTVDGVKVRIAPSSRMPADTNLMIVHPDVTTFADVLTDYVTHKNPRGINGTLIEGRIAYDAFVDTNQVNNIAIHKTS